MKKMGKRELLEAQQWTARRTVVFLSDFGTSDGAVSAMHGVANAVSADLGLYDLTHDVPQFNIWEASYRLAQSLPYWAAGTVFVCVVDPGVGSDRKSIVALSAETLFYLVVVSLKYFSIFPMALLFVSITQPSAFASSLNRLGLSYRISYAVSLALRYLPEVTKNYVHILHAQMARGVSLSADVPVKKRFSSLARVLSPLVLSSLDRIDIITNAMILRGFGRMERRTWYMQSPLVASDYLIMVALLLLLGFSLYSRFVNNVMFWYLF